MLEKFVSGNIFNTPLREIAFAVSNGNDKDDFTTQICNYWPGFDKDKKDKIEGDYENHGLGKIISRKSSIIDKTLHGLICHGQGGRQEWENTHNFIKKCLNAIPGEGKIALVSVGDSFMARINFADRKKIIEEGIASTDVTKDIWLYSFKTFEEYYDYSEEQEFLKIFK